MNEISRQLFGDQEQGIEGAAQLVKTGTILIKKVEEMNLPCNQNYWILLNRIDPQRFE